MKTIAVASSNPVKINAALSAFQRLFGEEFSIQSAAVPSGISDQPMSSQETLTGAMNRVLNCRKALPDADFWVGIEGGIEEEQGEMAAFAWVVVLSSNMLGKSRTGVFYLPSPVVELIRQGKEMGEADDIVFRQHNSKQNNGAIGLLSDNVLDRTDYYEQAVILALLPFKNPQLYPHLMR